jgi:hypothetical protein
MTITLDQALENIYASLHNENENLDTHIAALRSVMAANGTKSIEVDTQKLVQPNRQGRKMMQSYFKKRGVEVTFASAD